MPPAVRSLGYVFTYNNYTDDIEAQIQSIAKNDDTIVFLAYAHEVGKTTNTPHLQGFMHLDHLMTLKEVSTLFGLKGLRLDIQRGQNHHNIAYITKQNPIHFEHGTMIDYKPSYCKLEIVKVIDAGITKPAFMRDTYFMDFYASHMRWCDALFASRPIRLRCPEINLFDWQIELYELLKTPPPERQILFYVDLQGKAGKSTFSRWLYNKLPGTFVAQPCAHKDFSYLIPEDCKVLILDVPRDAFDYIPYTSLEGLKDGFIISTKYEPIAKAFPEMHIIVFCNEIPPSGRLSNDRICVKEIFSNQ